MYILNHIHSLKLNRSRKYSGFNWSL